MSSLPASPNISSLLQADRRRVGVDQPLAPVLQEGSTAMTTRFLCAAAIASLACVPAALAGTPATKADSQPTVYVAQLHPVNAKVTGRRDHGRGSLLN